MNVLLLGSKSISRQKLLREARIPFELVQQDANEHECDWNLSLEQTTRSIARHKMKHVLLPHGNNGDICFVLTADSLTADKYGRLHGKPLHKEDARQKFTLFNEGVRVGTAFCLERKQWINDTWVTQQAIEQFVDAACDIQVSDDMFEEYIHYIADYLNLSAGLDIQDFGAQFVKSITGSYTTIIGLPMYELRLALISIGFF